MDTYTLATMFAALGFAFVGEKFRAGAYSIVASMFWFLFAWRIAEPGFYIASAAAIVILLYRGIYADMAAEFPSSSERETPVNPRRKAPARKSE